jgi:hypothetical protein
MADIILLLMAIGDLTTRREPAGFTEKGYPGIEGA